MDAAAIFLLLVGALAGGFVTGLAGFGTAMMALGIWLHVLPPSIAVPLASQWHIDVTTSLMTGGSRVALGNVLHDGFLTAAPPNR